MAKRILWANVHVPAEPRVRFYLHAAAGSCRFCDVTEKVAKLVVEELEDGTGYCGLLRLDAEGALVWMTKHASLQETKWHAEFEYGMPEEKWIKFEDSTAMQVLSTE